MKKEKKNPDNVADMFATSAPPLTKKKQAVDSDTFLLIHISVYNFQITFMDKANFYFDKKDINMLKDFKLHFFLWSTNTCDMHRTTEDRSGRTC